MTVVDVAPAVVYSWRKNRRETVRATLSTYRGVELADVRVYVPNADGELRPTQKGIAVRVEDLPRLHAAVDALITAHEGPEGAAAA